MRESEQTRQREMQRQEAGFVTGKEKRQRPTVYHGDLDPRAVTVRSFESEALEMA